MTSTPTQARQTSPREREWLARLPTRPLRRFLWDRLKHRRIQRIVETRFGARMHCDTRDFIQRYVYYFGLWEPNLTAFLPRRLNAGDVFVDVGANAGYFSLLGARAVTATGRVVAVEPEPGIRDLLVRNLSLNEPANVRVVGEASTDVECLLRLIFGGVHNTGGTSAVAATERDNGVLVRGRPLYNQLTTDERQRARIIKIDVEGAELHVLRGLHLERADFREDLEVVVEVSPERLRARGHEPQDLFALLKSQGFHPYSLHNDYRVRSYLESPPPRAPTRAEAIPQHESDFVFSRVDAPEL